MNTTEFSIEFDKMYDNLASMGAPGVDAYEKSLFLTYAQESIVKSLVTGTPNISILNESFEIDESTRRSLDNIVYPFHAYNDLTKHNLVKLVRTISTPKNENELVTEHMLNEGLSYLVKIDDDTYNDMWFIMQEQANINFGSCGSKWVDVIPKGHDEYTQIYNPFRLPNIYQIWRFNLNSKSLSNSLSTKNGFELISNSAVDEYKCRYIKKPKPIIVDSLYTSNTYLYENYAANATLSIDNIQDVTECELNSKIHRLILNKAVELAIATYKESNFQNKLITNQGLT